MMTHNMRGYIGRGFAYEFAFTVSDDDYKKLSGAPWHAAKELVQYGGPVPKAAWTQVTDLVTGKQLLVRPESCGAGCFCAARVKEVRRG
jgi:hypothetical protein